MSRPRALREKRGQGRLRLGPFAACVLSPASSEVSEPNVIPVGLLALLGGAHSESLRSDWGRRSGKTPLGVITLGAGSTSHGSSGRLTDSVRSVGPSQRP